MDSNTPKENDGIHADFDNQTAYTTPRAWRNAKKAMNGMANDLPALVKLLEEHSHADKICIRIALRAALYGYVSQDQKGRMAMHKNTYNKDGDNKITRYGPKAEQLPREERVMEYYFEQALKAAGCEVGNV